MNSISLHNHLVPIRSPLSHIECQLNRTASKTRSLWNLFRDWMGEFLRDAFFLPIPANPTPAIQKGLKREEDFVAAFWNAGKATDLNYPYQEKIREIFTVNDQPIKMLTTDGKLLQITCRIIEPKIKSDAKSYNCVHVLGNISTISNNIDTPYPYLAAYLEEKKKDPTLSPARFVLISQYDMQVDGAPFKPRSLDEAGLILKKTLDTLYETYGEIDHLVAHSLGSIIFASALKHFEGDAKAFPQHIHFDRAPSSIEAASKTQSFGSILHFLATLSGWSVDIGKELADFYLKNPKVPCIVSGVKYDFYFPGPASLHEHKKIKEISQVKVLIFDPPHQLFHMRAHHGLRADLLNGHYLVDHSDRQFLREKEHLATASMRHTFQKLKLSQLRSA